MTGRPLWSTELRDDGDTRVVALTGELDLDAADELTTLLIEQLDMPGTATVVVDLAGVSFLDSAALGALILAFQHAGEVGRVLRIVEPQHSVRRVLEITGMSDILAGNA